MSDKKVLTKNEARLRDEFKIVKKLVAELLSHGFELKVYDGEEFVEFVNGTELSTNRTEILKEMRATDQDTLHAYKNGEFFGWVSLVYGNDPCEVIADSTVNMEEFTKDSTAYAETFPYNSSTYY